MIITTDGNIPSRFAHSFNVTKMAQGFYNIGQDVELVTFFSLRNLLYKLKIKDIYEYYALSKNIKIKMLPAFDKNIFIKTTGGERYNKKAAQYIESQNPNFVFCRSYLTPYYCVKLGLPTIMETHTTNYDLPALRKSFGAAKDKNFLGLVTINEKLKKEYAKRGVPEEKIIVLEDGVDLNLFDIEDDKEIWRKELSLPSDKKIIAYVGGLYREKGIEQILLTAQKLQTTEIIFVLVGGKQEQIREWKKYCAEKNISNVAFAGFACQSDVPKYIKAADVLIMPYDTRINYKVMDINSTSPLKLFEYMGSKRPIVSTAIPVIEKVVSHNESAMLAESNNVEQLAQYVRELLNNPERGGQLSEKAFKLAKQYEWKVRCEKIIKTFIKN
ncbi:MAG: glycosyltransferase [Patescibacteria group bacterium]